MIEEKNKYIDGIFPCKHKDPKHWDLHKRNLWVENVMRFDHIENFDPKLFGGGIDL